MRFFFVDSVESTSTTTMQLIVFFVFSNEGSRKKLHQNFTLPTFSKYFRQLFGIQSFELSSHLSSTDGPVLIGISASIIAFMCPFEFHISQNSLLKFSNCFLSIHINSSSPTITSFK